MKKQKITWRNERRRLKDLVPCEHNPNTNTDVQSRNLRKSIKLSGYVEPIVIDADGTVLVGEHRRAEMIALGGNEQEVDVRVPDRKLTREEFDRYLIASNALRGTWDIARLEAFAPELLMDIGMDEATLAELWDSQLEVDDDGFDEIAELKKLEKPTVKPGDYYELGIHRLGCIDSTDLVAVKKLVGKERIDFIDIDPPFNIGWSYSGKNNKYGGQEKDDRSPEEYRGFLRSLIFNALAVAKKDAHAVVWCDERFVWLLQTLYAELGIESRRLCIWVKGSALPTPKIAFGKSTEFAAYGTVGTPFLNEDIKNFTTVLNKEVGSGNRAIEDIVDLYNVWLVKRLPGNEYEHPTQKPPTLHEKALRRCTKVGDNLLDLTAGSGSLMVAAEAMKRRAFLAEMDPLFATLILNRYEKLTGNKARKIN